MTRLVTVVDTSLFTSPPAVKMWSVRARRKAVPFPDGEGVRRFRRTGSRRFGPADRRPASAQAAPEEARVRTASVPIPRGESPPLSKPRGGYLLIPAVRLARLVELARTGPASAHEGALP